MWFFEIVKRKEAKWKNENKTKLIWVLVGQVEMQTSDGLLFHANRWFIIDHFVLYGRRCAFLVRSHSVRTSAVNCRTSLAIVTNANKTRSFLVVVSFFSTLHSESCGLCVPFALRHSRERHSPISRALFWRLFFCFSVVQFNDFSFYFVSVDVPFAAQDVLTASKSICKNNVKFVSTRRIFYRRLSLSIQSGIRLLAKTQSELDDISETTGNLQTAKRAEIIEHKRRNDVKI